MAKITTVFWRDIPAQVIAKQGRSTVKVPLSERFHEAIDKAAMRAGMAGSDAYLEAWRRDVANCGADLQSIVDSRVAELEANYSDQILADMVRNKGIDPTATSDGE